MKRVLCLIFVFAMFMACGDDDKVSSIKTIRYIDLSDLIVYKGTAAGAEEIVYNDFKNRTIASYFFKNRYSPDFYKYYNLDFNNDILTYVFGTSDNNQTKIVSTFTFQDGKLFILNADTLKFVAYGDSPDNLYLERAIARYPVPGENKDTIHTFDVRIGADTILKLAGHTSLEDVKLDTDTIVWCNIKYQFN